MRLWEILNLVWINILENKFKVILTSLGIIVGSTTIVIVIAIGQGGQQDVAEQFKNLNAGTVTITQSITSSVGGGLGNMGGGGMGGSPPSGRSSGGEPPSMMGGGQTIKKVTFTEEDMAEISLFVSNIAQIAMMAQGSSEVDGGTLEDSLTTTIVGATSDYLTMSNLSLLQGNFFSSEEAGYERVAILGYDQAVSIFENVFDAYDSQIKINNKKYTVIGVLEKTGSMVSDITIDGAIFLPIDTAEKYVFGSSGFDPQIAVVVEDIEEIMTTMAAIKQLLSEMYPTGQFAITDAGTQVVASQKSADTLSFLLIAVATIVFIVGGIGIMNVLFVSVKERTKEIGILKALGSAKRDILLQFLLEANLMSIFGGVVGVGLSYLLMPVIRYLGMTVLPSNEGAILALVFALCTGTAFGFYPAWQAAGLRPIEALNQD